VVDPGGAHRDWRAVAADLHRREPGRAIERPTPGFPLQYAPPEGLGPVQTEYIRTEAVPKHALTATLLHLAERGLISLDQTGDEKWTICGLVAGDAWDDIDPVSFAAGRALGVNRLDKEFEAHATAAAGRKLSTARTDVATAGKSVAQRSAQKQLDTAVGAVLALGQTYPDLKSSANFPDLQRNLADTEDKLAFARQYYNDAVATSNRLICSIARRVSPSASTTRHRADASS
jgi:hypothetical protein